MIFFSFVPAPSTRERIISGEYQETIKQERPTEQISYFNYSLDREHTVIKWQMDGRADGIANFL